ncbi:uncharacterized protein SPPG_03212 [Spizellomyces punctatus DAOM BR117]|uniref:Wbp11/ELF5/Saf1 N-terminal domain-containing protein n=1 Tax=Spizellomyces punctatus (strain DAOM BR117) TaxID=645134 RepID=A0A0L0HJV6_SPIPD|nr:uncharacterized protein SPPG_03212 [Spizellomyces punctatus DAOM BR117]KND01402.1 hypothetical protein SPPG_03212 [Spizellomyces punctatus DAOM BR117]|eukprot:XP_016609441.1 hypothetical protein SPPG_03212 [Spizellomyces punctatus DAOM BR117]
MGRKSGKSMNPADAHRKLQRKRELKKNKEERKKIRLITTAQKDTSKVLAELATYRELEQTDPTVRTKRQYAEQRIKKINEARQQLGLAPVDPNAPLPKQKQKKEADVEMKWYHPTFNPHGPKKPAHLDEESEGDSDESEGDSDSSVSSSEGESEQNEPETVTTQKAEPEPMLQYDDLSYIPLPDGATPNFEAQIYVTLELPEIRNKADYKTSPARDSSTQPPATPGQVRPTPGQHHNPYPTERPPEPPFGPPYRHPGQWGPPSGPGMPIPGYYRPPFMPPPHGMPPGPPPYPPFGPPGFMPRPGPPFMGPPPGMAPYGPPPGFHGGYPHSSVNTAPEAGPQPEPQPAPAPVIAAAPQMRDLQAESVKLIPASLLRKKTTAGQPKLGSAPKPLRPPPKKALNAAPDVEGEGGESPLPAPSAPAPPVKKPPVKAATDEYDEFMSQMKDLL